jgi:hypothetical protein
MGPPQGLNNFVFKLCLLCRLFLLQVILFLYVQVIFVASYFATEYDKSYVIFILPIFNATCINHNYALWTSNLQIGWLERPRCRFGTLDVQSADWILHFGRNIYMRCKVKVRMNDPVGKNPKNTAPI